MTIERPFKFQKDLATLRVQRRYMANSSNEIDADRFGRGSARNGRADRTVISEFRANMGSVSGQMERMPILLLTMTGAKTGRS